MTEYKKPKISVIKSTGIIRIPSCGGCQATWGSYDWCEVNRWDE